MIGQDDTAIFLNNNHFSEFALLSNGANIKAIYDIDEDNQFGGLVEGRAPSILISTADYQANLSALAHRQTLMPNGVQHEIESVEPYGADRSYTVLTLRFS